MFVAKIVQTEGENQACLSFMLRCSLSYAKIVQTEGKKTSLLEFYAEVQPILCKDSANRRQKNKLA